MFELIYTSYPRGLKTGTSGFTPVAYTEGIPKNYIHICESLSGYPFIYPLGHPLYDQNPEIYSHYKFKLQGKSSSDLEQEKEEISILSRISSAGKDYTGRENKIAHHIILDSKEREFLLEGPAQLMLYADLFIENWDKNPSLLPPRNIQNIPLKSIQNSKLKFLNQNKIERLNIWESVFGSGEPAYILSQSAENNHAVPSFILFTLNNLNKDNLIWNNIIKNKKIGQITDIEQITDQDNEIASIYSKKMNLFLIYDALNLVSSDKKWNITFNTYFVSDPIDSKALWRFCPCPAGDNFQYTGIVSNYVQKYPDSIVIDIQCRTIYGKKNLKIYEKENISENNKIYEKENISENNKIYEKENISEENKIYNTNDNIYIKSEDNADINTDMQKGNFPGINIGAIEVSKYNALDISTYRIGISKEDKSNTGTTGKIEEREAAILETEQLKEPLNRSQYFILLLIATAICIGFIYILCIQDINIKTDNVKISSIKTEDVTIQLSIDQTVNKSTINKAKPDQENQIDGKNQKDKAKPDQENQIDGRNQNITHKQRVIFRFYDSNNNKVIVDDNDLKNIKCSLIKNNGLEIDTYFEKPITSDTPNWDIVSKTFQQPLGYIEEPSNSISVQNINLYNKNLYSAIYLDIPSKEHKEFIWLNQINISISMIFKGLDLVSNAVEIRFNSEISQLLQDFLLFLPPESLSGAVELKSYKTNNSGENEEINEETADKNNINDNNNSSNNNDNNNSITNEESLPIQQTEQENTLLTYPECVIKRDEKTNETYIQLKFTDKDFDLIVKNNMQLTNETNSSIDNNKFINETFTNSSTINTNKFDIVSNIQFIKIEYKDKPSAKTYSILSFISSNPAR